jgi:transcriptional regulator GlxA family with amidase domain
MHTLTVGFVLAEHFTLSAFSLFVDALRLAADEDDRSRPIRCRWLIMGSRPDPVRASCGVALMPTAGLVDPRELDYVIVVGGILHAGRQVDRATIAYLRRAAATGARLIGLCTGSFILCRAGLMNSRRCCVSWFHYQDFVSEFPDHEAVADQLFVVDNDRITCAGGAGVADLANHLIERHLGHAVAQKSREVLLFDHARQGHDPQPHPPVADAVANPRLRRALLLMEQHLADPLPVRVIAKRLDISVRQLERSFQAGLGERPAALYRRLRLRYARWLLDNTDRTIGAIALDAGFADGAHLSRRFKEIHGRPPSDNRAAAQHRPNETEQIAASRVFDGPRANWIKDVVFRKV